MSQLNSDFMLGEYTRGLIQVFFDELCEAILTIKITLLYDSMTT